MSRILNLDDCREMGKLVALVLERAGYECVSTDDSYEAWALLHTLPFDLLTQDTMRPDIDGIEFYHRVRADETLDDLPLVMVTARSRPENPEQVFEAGLDGYLTKPFAPETLEEILAEALRGRGKPVPKGPGQERRPLSTAQLLEQLRSGSSAERLWAARDLGLRRREEGIGPLLAALEDPDAGVRWATALALGRIGDSCALESLIAALDDDDYLVRMMVAHALEKIDDDRAGDGLIERLDDDSEWVQRVAAHALGTLDYTEAIPALARTLSGATVPVKREAAAALGQMGGRAVEVLVSQLKADDVTVRRAAMVGLSCAGKDEGMETPIIDALGDEDAQVRREAAQTLGRQGSQRAVEPLVALLADENPDVVVAAAWTLGWLGDPQVLPALERIVREDTRQNENGYPVARAARWAIDNIQARSEEGDQGLVRVRR